MKELLSSYSMGQIFLFLIMAALAIKQLISFFDWASARVTKQVDKEKKPIKIEQRLTTAISERDQQIQQLRQDQARIEKSISQLDKKLNILIASDKDDIKAWITAQHHHFMEKGYIDYYSLDCISRRYEDYKREDGNTFIDDLMEEINSLPKDKKLIKEDIEE